MSKPAGGLPGVRGVVVPRFVWRWPRRSPADATRLAVPAARDQLERQLPPPDIGDETHEEEDIDDVLPWEVTQQLTRRHDSDGRDLMLGYLRGGFEPGERSQNLHVAFCPPFEGTPALAVHQMSGPPVAIKLAQVETYGARLELKLAAKTGQTESVVVQFEAHWAACRGRPRRGLPLVIFPRTKRFFSLDAYTLKCSGCVALLDVVEKSSIGPDATTTSSSASSETGRVGPTTTAGNRGRSRWLATTSDSKQCHTFKTATSQA